MAITAALVKELRERTGSGMMECKKALVETDGDVDAAIELMRSKGQAKAEKRAGKVAAEGITLMLSSDDSKTAVILEVNSETDFVSKGDDFLGFSNAIARQVLENKPADIDALMAMEIDGVAVDDVRKNLIAKIGENINIRRFQCIETEGQVATYSHGARIGVLVEYDGGTAETGRDIAMHVAASNPNCIQESDVPAELLEKERRVVEAQAKESGKPDNIIEKMIDGRMKKYLKEITLLGQPFVKDPDQMVEKYLKGAGATVKSFVRYEVGEGIEKKVENFADEVMAQARG
ncbi:MAG: elongation factor Ts [Methylococcales bacterium]|jgi:elongation factor Ts|nr:elongation factor Ts [Methylococcales bacterium]MBT7443861.1 elongation factor Ts [Methylococcales bacterium]